MPRPTWTGSITFGLVAVPVKLYAATESHTIRFHQLQRDTGERVRHQRISESSGEEVEYRDIVKGYELSDGQYVVVDPEELQAIEPGRSRSIEIEDFIHLDAVDPVYFQKSYYVAPADEGAAKPYELLRTALHDSRRVGVARFVMRNKQYLSALRAGPETLLLESMFFADEIRAPAAISEMRYLDEPIDLGERELSVAGQLIDSLTADWDPSAYEDTYRQRVLDLIERKAEGDEIVTEPEAEPAPVLDLMAALQASVHQARGSRGRATSDGRGPGQRIDLDELSRDELYAEAQRRNISGRSRMSKDDLVEALEQAS